MGAIERLSLTLASLLSSPFMVKRLYRRRDRIGQIYNLAGIGQYQLFRETVCRKAVEGPPVVLVIGFRLKCLGSNIWLHWLFQKVCIITTPFWCGLRGFGIKLWLVEPRTKSYLGIYEWHGQAAAQKYLDFLLPILGFFSVNKSIWYQRQVDTGLAEFLSTAANR